MLIEFIRAFDGSVWIDPDGIVALETLESVTAGDDVISSAIVLVSGHRYAVKMTPQQVMRTIAFYKDHKRATIQWSDEDE